MMATITDAATKANIARNVQHLLDKRCWSQAILSELSGESPMYISRICRGQHLPNAKSLAAIAAALGTSSEALLQ